MREEDEAEEEQDGRSGLRVSGEGRREERVVIGLNGSIR